MNDIGIMVMLIRYGTLAILRNSKTCRVVISTVHILVNVILRWDHLLRRYAMILL